MHGAECHGRSQSSRGDRAWGGEAGGRAGVLGADRRKAEGAPTLGLGAVL